MENTLIRKMDEGQQVLGAFSTLSVAAAVECLALSGLDFVIIDTEHGIGDVETTLSSLTAAQLRGCSPLVRIKDSSRSSVLKMLDIGASGLIVPYVDNIDEVKMLVEYAKYSPVGSRGYGIVRSSDYGNTELTTEQYFQWSNENTLLIPQCETAACLRDIEEIAGIDGVDGIFVGPYDLSVALGVPGQMHDSKLINAIVRVIAACRAERKYAFIFAGSPEIAKEYYNMGFDAVACSVDTSLLIGAAKSMAKKVRDFDK